MSWTSRLPGLLLPVLVLGSLTAAAAQRTPPPDPVWRPRDLVRQERIGGLDVGPGGARIVWELRRPDEKRRRLVGDLRLTVPDEPPRTVELTRGHASDGSPRFAPDGRRVAFLSDRDLPDAEDPKPGKPQVWVISLEGGEPRPVTRFRRGVKGFDWIDPDHLVVAAGPDPDLRARRLEARHDDTVEVEDEERWVPVRLWLVDLDGEVRPLTSNRDEIDAFAVDRVHRRVLSRHLPTPHWGADHRGTPRLVLTEIDTRRSRELAVDRRVLPETIAFTRDGSAALAIFTETSRPDQLAAGRSRLAFWRDGMEGFRPVPALANEEILRLAPTARGAVLVAAEGTRTGLIEAIPAGDGFRLRWIAGGDHVTAAAAAPEGSRIAAVRSRADRPPQLELLAVAEGRATASVPLSKLNPGLAVKPMAKVEVIRWRGAGGDTVEGLLFHPTRRYGDGPAPLVVMIHGGPASAERDVWREGWAYAAHAYAQRGAYVLKPNYHGSTGYGLAFTESIAGRYYELEVPDILAGIDELARRGLIDLKRVALVGWSNGAILSIALSLERHFAAVSAGAGDVNWTSDFGNCAFGPNFDRFYLGSEPWTDPELYLRKSPLFEMERVTSPTLIFFGTEDTSVPTEQGWEHYRALQQIGKAPVRFLLFSGEPHSLRDLVHQERKLAEELAWLDRHLFGRPPEPEPQLPDAAPLAVSELAESLSRVADRLGAPGPGGELLPETVPVAALPGLEVGVAEVTRAQWAAFSGEAPPSGEGDLPAAVTAEQAQAYCRWLSQRTGRTWRLPTRDELDTLRRAAVKKVGRAATLDLWAGEELTGDDAAALRNRIGADPLARLLRPAATSDAVTLPRPGAGPWDPEAVLFDLGGGLAEWCRRDGKLLPCGPSVLRATVERAPLPGEPAGLRVVVELSPTPGGGGAARR